MRDDRGSHSNTTIPPLLDLTPRCEIQYVRSHKTYFKILLWTRNEIFNCFCKFYDKIIYFQLFTRNDLKLLYNMQISARRSGIVTFQEIREDGVESQVIIVHHVVPPLYRHTKP